MDYSSNNEFFERLKTLVESWCDRRSLRPLSRVLGPYLSFNGMTDGWVELAEGLKSIRAQDRDKLTAEETAVVDGLIRATDKAIYGK
jgi:hypothetical protein